MGLSFTMASPLRGLALTAAKPGIFHVTAVTINFRSATTARLFGTSQQVAVSTPQISSTAAQWRPPTSSYRPLRSFHTSRTSLSSSKFTYGIAASFTTKDRRYNPERNVFNFNPYNRILARRKDKRTRPDSGQDAFFVSRVGESTDVA